MGKQSVAWDIGYADYWAGKGANPFSDFYLSQRWLEGWEAARRSHAEEQFEDKMEEVLPNDADAPIFSYDFWDPVVAMSNNPRWGAAIEKIQEEGRCRVYGCTNMDLDPAHTIGRSAQDRKDPSTGKKITNPDSVVPLCRDHHMLYDQYRLDLLANASFITDEEACDAVISVGIARAYQRMTGGKSGGEDER